MSGGPARNASPAAAYQHHSRAGPSGNVAGVTRQRTTSPASSRGASPVRGEELVKGWNIPQKDMNSDDEWPLPKKYVTKYSKPDLPKAIEGSAVGVSNAFSHHHVSVRMVCRAHREDFVFELDLYKQCEKSFNENCRRTLKPGNKVTLGCPHYQCVTDYQVVLHPRLFRTKPNNIQAFQNFLKDSSPLDLDAENFETASISHFCPKCRWVNAGPTREPNLGNYQRHCQNDFDDWLYENLVGAWVAMPKSELPTGDVEQWKWAFGKLLTVRRVDETSEWDWHNKRWNTIRDAYMKAQTAIRREERKIRVAAEKVRKEAEAKAHEEALTAERKFKAQMRQRVQEQKALQDQESQGQGLPAFSQGLGKVTNALSKLSPYSRAAPPQQEQQPLLSRSGSSYYPASSRARTSSRSPVRYGATDSGSTGEGYKGKGKGEKAAVASATARVGATAASQKVMVVIVKEMRGTEAASSPHQALKTVAIDWVVVGAFAFKIQQ